MTGSGQIVDMGEDQITGVFLSPDGTKLAYELDEGDSVWVLDTTLAEPPREVGELDACSHCQGRGYVS